MHFWQIDSGTAATLVGGGVGVLLLLTVMTSQQRLGFGLALIALALPALLLALTISPAGLDRACLAGVVLMTTVAFVAVDAYLALLTVALIGVILVAAIRVAVAIRPAGRLG